MIRSMIVGTCCLLIDVRKRIEMSERIKGLSIKTGIERERFHIHHRTLSCQSMVERVVIWTSILDS